MTKLGKSLGDIMKKRQENSKYVNHEFQTYGSWLSAQLDADKKQMSLFIKLAKNEDRSLIQTALEFVKGVNRPKNKVALFLWKLKEIKKEKKAKEDGKDNKV